MFSVPSIGWQWLVVSDVQGCHMCLMWDSSALSALSALPCQQHCRFHSSWEPEGRDCGWRRLKWRRRSKELQKASQWAFQEQGQFERWPHVIPGDLNAFFSAGFLSSWEEQCGMHFSSPMETGFNHIFTSVWRHRLIPSHLLGSSACPAVQCSLTDTLFPFGDFFLALEDKFLSQSGWFQWDFSSGSSFLMFPFLIYFRCSDVLKLFYQFLIIWYF